MEPRRGLMLGRWLVFCAILLAGSAARLPSVTGSTRQSPPFTWRMPHEGGESTTQDPLPRPVRPPQLDALAELCARRGRHASDRRASGAWMCSSSASAGTTLGSPISSGPARGWSGPVPARPSLRHRPGVPRAWLLRCRLLDRPVRGLLGTAGGRSRDPAPEPGRK